MKLIKPSWDKAPDWAAWLAQNKDGNWWWFEDKPAIFDNEFSMGNSEIGRVSIAKRLEEDWYMQANWHETLEERPHQNISISSQEEEEAWQAKEREQSKSSGGDNDYWIATVNKPKRLEPYQAECEDLIELFQMTFQEGEAFKALWRKGQLRIGNGKPGDTLLRNSEKAYHYSGRMVAMESE